MHTAPQLREADTTVLGDLSGVTAEAPIAATPPIKVTRAPVPLRTTPHGRTDWRFWLSVVLITGACAAAYLAMDGPSATAHTVQPPIK